MFSKPLKERLAKLVKDDFEIDLGIERSPARRNDQEFTPIGRQRQDAFFLCRGTLIREKIAAYPEQFEGMYTLMRGLATAGLLVFAYFGGMGFRDHSDGFLKFSLSASSRLASRIA